MQPGDHFFGPLFPRDGNDVFRNPVGRRRRALFGLFRFPFADAALRARLAEKFFGPFFFTALALPKTEHRKPHFKQSLTEEQA